MPFEVSKFYRTSATSSGIQRQRVREALYIPDPDLSENEDAAEELVDEIAEYEGEINVTNELFEGLTDNESSESDSTSSDDEDDESDDDDDDNEPPKKKTQPTKDPSKPKWRKKSPVKVNSQFKGPPFPNPPVDDLVPKDYFDMFFDNDLIELIAEQTKLYSVQCSQKNINTKSSEIEQFLGILIMMGIIKYPSYRMYWSTGTRVPAIADAMSLNRFEDLKRYFHVSDNSKMPQQGEENYDKLYKVRPMIESVRAKCRALPQEDQSVDEQIVPTKARSSLRQYLPKKPHKWGFKVWARCGNSGMLYDFEVYTGKQEDNKEFGKVGAVVKRLVENLPKNVGHKVYFDNLFSSINLVKALKEEGIWSLGTIRSNHLKGAGKLLKSKKDMVAEGRGAVDYRVDVNSNIILVRWFDNGLVQLVSSFVGIESGVPVKRWSAKDKKKIDVPCPQIVQEYNKHMGGVDLCDMLMALYRIKLRTRKWYMHLVYYCIGVSITNVWVLYRRHCEQGGIAKKNVLPLLKFQSQIGHSLLSAGKVGPQAPQHKQGRPSMSPPANEVPNQRKRQKTAVAIPQDDIRLDKMGHFPMFSDKQQRCRFCTKGYSRIHCTKCQVYLCLVKDRNCFYQFHNET